MADMEDKLDYALTNILKIARKTHDEKLKSHVGMILFALRDGGVIPAEMYNWYYSHWLEGKDKSNI